ncbi:FAD binding domain-containing protein [Yoonia sp. 2307UL14-13]|uniref:FAD binding domain-containing protein n=1 Tax=Yoonia sp. 2307UL14-13 TaxID=3126506 RepID=UPI0030A5D1F7
MDSHSYQRPDSLQGALDILATGGWQIAAGCTDLFPATKRKQLEGPMLDITSIAELRGVTGGKDGLRIGAATTWTDIIRADLPPAMNGLKLAAREVGAMQIQNRGTIAGNLCNASPAADGVPPLLTLDAQIEVRGATGMRVVALNTFVVGPRQTTLQSGEMVTAILIPKASLAGVGNFSKLGARTYLIISVAMTAARITVTDGLVTQAALAIGSCGPVATRVPLAEAAILGKPPSAELITDDMVAAAIAPIDDVRADAGYRHISAAELLRRTVAALA